jgi:soluble lytic murein transglycosylase-like protein
VPRASERRHRALAVVLAGVVLTPISAHSDEAIDRRLAALQALVKARPLAPAGRRGRDPSRIPTADEGCTLESPWRSTAAELHRRIDRAIRDAARRYAVDHHLIRSVILHESNFQTNAVSYRGAQGLMQLMPATARELGVRCAFDPRENILAGTRYLRAMHDRFGTWSQALAAYNAGPNRVASGNIPYESRRYARRVMNTWQGRAHP